MADWVDIDNTTIEPDAPLISSTMFALRDNPKAIAEGAAGAPKITGSQSKVVQASALYTTTAERDWVLARTAGASRGAVGTYALLKNTSQLNPPSGGQTAPGSALEYAVLDRDTGETVSAGNPSGTWRNMGAGTSLTNATTLFLRIA